MLFFFTLQGHILGHGATQFQAHTDMGDYSLNHVCIKKLLPDLFCSYFSMREQPEAQV